MCIYKERYNKLIYHYKNTITEGYVEKHHIVPKCLGGTDDIDNLVALPPKAHFICHYLLHKMHPDNNSLAYAFSMMSVNNPYQNRKNTGRLYELSKVARSNAMKGVPRPEWVKEKLRKPKQNKENYKGKKSVSHRENISKALKGKPKSNKHVIKLVQSNKPHYERRKKETQERRERLRKEFISSGLTRKQFAEKVGLSYSIIKKNLVGL